MSQQALAGRGFLISAPRTPLCSARPPRGSRKVAKPYFLETTDVVGYELKGSEMQFVEIELDPGEAAVGEADSMLFMDAGIHMETVFGGGDDD